MTPDTCKRRGDESRRLRTCRWWDGSSGRCIDKRRPGRDCPGFAWDPPPSREPRERSPGRPPIEPNPPRTPEERVSRWRALLAAFQESTGIAVGTPPLELDTIANPEDVDLGPGDYSIPQLGSLFDPRTADGRPWPFPDPTLEWPGRDPTLVAVLRSEAFANAVWMHPYRGPHVPRYDDLKDAAEAWRALRDAARRVAECGDEIEARHAAGKGLGDWRPGDKDARTRWATAWLPIPGTLQDAARVLADASIPSVKVPTGRPAERARRALAALVEVLSDVKRTDGLPLSVPDLTRLVMLALPDRYPYENELLLRRRVEKARELSVPTKPRRK